MHVRGDIKIKVYFSTCLQNIDKHFFKICFIILLSLLGFAGVFFFKGWQTIWTDLKEQCQDVCDKIITFQINGPKYDTLIL